MINDKMVSVPGAPVVGFPGAQGAPLQFGASDLNYLDSVLVEQQPLGLGDSVISQILMLRRKDPIRGSGMGDPLPQT